MIQPGSSSFTSYDSSSVLCGAEPCNTQGALNSLVTGNDEELCFRVLLSITLGCGD